MAPRTPALLGGTTAAYLAGSVAAGVVTALLMELPFLRLRDRLLPSPARAAV